MFDFDQLSFKAHVLPGKVAFQVLLREAKPLPAAFPPLAQTWCSFLGAFVGVATLGLLHAYVIIPMMHETLLIGAFGAMSVIIFSAWKVRGPVGMRHYTVVMVLCCSFSGLSKRLALALAGTFDEHGSPMAFKE